MICECLCCFLGHVQNGFSGVCHLQTVVISTGNSFNKTALYSEIFFSCMFPVIGGVQLKKGNVECRICIALMSFDWPNELRSHVRMRPRVIGWLAMLDLLNQP